MKLPFLVVMNAAVAFSAVGQRISISSPVHLARWPYENFYKFRVENLPCTSVVVKPDQGEITQDGCNLIYHADSVGNTVFRVFRKSAHGLQPIDIIEMGVRANERIDVQLGNHLGGLISKDEVLLVGGVLVREYVNEGHAEGIHLISFRIVRIHGDSTWSIRNVGRAFNQEALSLLQTLQQNDMLVIADIEAGDYKRASISVRPAEFTIQ